MSEDVMRRATAGDASASWEVFNRYEKDANQFGLTAMEAYPFLKYAAQQGHLSAMRRLGVILTGNDFGEPDYCASIEYLESFIKRTTGMPEYEEQIKSALYFLCAAYEGYGDVRCASNYYGRFKALVEGDDRYDHMVLEV
ncbi:hypothetical protein A6E01_20430 (plasmid) [Vibrio breoganii]|uniref:Sel1 repeat family protein n=1 Tax=Vibrio breoganii TaxID=553239 RepID=A0AAN0XZZ2_9VIBR|nr:hypothetical protein [Vibrio breoganii]ANO35582.1 hypothetical protein A6E01_20430 [Vibrio breoganii]